MLEVKNIFYNYGDAVALRDVSLTVRKGEFLAVVGANAAGKTTLIKTISSILRSSRGEIYFDGERIDTLSSHEVVGLGLIQIPEGRQVFPAMTVRENLELGAYHPRVRKNRKATMENVLSRMPRLEERLGQLAGTLSGGEQQMLALGRALMAVPRLLMFDEPSLGLAPMMVRQLFALAREINKQGVTVLMVEQNVNQCLRAADRGYVLENGAIILEGTGHELLCNEDVKKAYLGL